MVKYHLYIQSLQNQFDVEQLVKWTENMEDSGVDIYIPRDVIVRKNETKEIHLGIRCKCVKIENGVEENVGFFLLPRSSIVKTPLRMSNSLGLIDAGYRGELIGVVDNIKDYDFKVMKGTRLFQIVNADVKPFSMVEVRDNLGSTDRNNGGFGSTGQ